MSELLGTPSLWSVVSGTSPIPTTAGNPFAFTTAASITATAADGDTVEFDCSFNAAAVEGAILTISNALNTALTLGAADTPPVHVLVPLSAGPVTISLAWPAGSPNAGDPLNVTLTPGAGSGGTGGGGGPTFTSPFSLGACTVRVLPVIDPLPGGDDGSEVGDYDDQNPVWSGTLSAGQSSDPFTIGTLPCHIEIIPNAGNYSVSIISDADMSYDEANVVSIAPVCLDVLRPAGLALQDFWGATSFACLFMGVQAFVTDMQALVTPITWNSSGADTDVTQTVAGSNDGGGGWRITNGNSLDGSPYAGGRPPVQVSGTTILSLIPYVESTAVSPPPPPPPPPPPVDCDELGRTSTAYVSGYYRTRVMDVRTMLGARRCLVANFNGAVSKSRTITSVTWRVFTGIVAVLSNARIQSGGRSAAVDFTANWIGDDIVRCEATFDNGEVYVQTFRIDVSGEPIFLSGQATSPGPTTLTASAS